MRKYFFIRSNNRYVKINFRDIVYVEARRNYVHIVLKDKSYLALLPMRQIEKLLPAATFYRVHRSYIVSLEYVCGFDHDHVYFEKGCVPISAQYRTQLMESVHILVSEYKKDKLVS